MEIVDEVYEWYKQNLPAFENRTGHKFTLKPPIGQEFGTKALPQEFVVSGNILDIFMWDFGNIDVHLFRGADGEPDIRYHQVGSAAEACRVVSEALEELVSLPQPTRQFPSSPSAKSDQ